MLTAHLDVVPAEGGDEWPHHPFKGIIENGRVWGRGSVDYKIGVAGMLQGSSRENILPAEVIALVNFRLVPGDHSDDIVKHVKEIALPLGIEVEFYTLYIRKMCGG